MESLLAYAFLLDVGLISSSNYTKYLNKLFGEASHDEFLLELQWCSSNIQKTTYLIFERAKTNEVNYHAFGESLMKLLKESYAQTDNLNDFSLKMISIYHKLPQELIQVEPFWSMSYAGEPLSWSPPDVEQTKEIYEKMFNFYQI